MPPGRMPPAIRGSRRASPNAPPEGAEFAEIPGSALRAASYSGWAKTLQARLYETARARVMVCESFKLASKPGESEGDFRARLALAVREKRDAAVAELRRKWQAKLLQLSDQIRRAEDRHAREQAQLSQQKMQTAVTIGSSILGALLGRKAISATNVGRIGTAARSATRIGRESRGRHARRGKPRSPAPATRGYAARSRSRGCKTRNHARILPRWR